MAGYSERMLELFRGTMDAHGVYVVPNSKLGGKLKGQARTLREPVTVDLWTKHLSGQQSLGVIPITKENTARWGVIDIDELGIDLRLLSAKIEDFKLPCIVCRSKSGGAHVFLFLADFVPAEDLIAKLRELSSGLGYGKAEVFPKQAELLSEKGDIGNWLNMPYFDADKTTRYAVRSDGSPAPLKQFLDVAEATRVTASQLEELKIENKHEELLDGPPCLQHLTSQGFPTGTRNHGLFALGVFLRKAFPDAWERKLEEYNRLFMRPPLDHQEVSDVSKSLKKRDYFYRCNDAPIVSYCNAPVCRTRKHGVGAGSAMPVFSGLSKLDTDEPIWFLDVEGKRVELTTDELQVQPRFQKRCMDTLNMMPPKMSEIAWQRLIQYMLDNVVVIEVPKEVSKSGKLEELLETFTSDRARALSRDELLIGKPWVEGGKIYFRLRDLEEFLNRHGIKINRSQIASYLKDHGGETKFFNIKSRGVNTWGLKAPAEHKEELAVPDFGRSPL